MNSQTKNTEFDSIILNFTHIINKIHGVLIDVLLEHTDELLNQRGHQRDVFGHAHRRRQPLLQVAQSHGRHAEREPRHVLTRRDRLDVDVLHLILTRGC